MKRLFCLFAAGALLVNCSDTGTGPTPDDDNPEETFEISWTLDSGLASSATVTSAEGGTVSATDLDGVSYTLHVPPGALCSDTVLTITPFADLAITGSGLTICEGCVPPDTLCCVRGALFEPDGLAFDTTAVLTIYYPVSVPMPPDTMGRIVLLGNDSDIYAPCSTSVDAAARTIETGISHFSGYGTDAPDCDRLSLAFINARDNMLLAKGTDSFYQVAGDFWSLRQAGFYCDGLGTCVEVCPGITGGVDSWIELAAGDHGNTLQSLFAGDPADWNTIDVLVQHSDAALRLAYNCPPAGRSGLRDTILGIIREKAGSLADEAWADCQNDRCEEGRTTLEALIDLAERGYIVDSAFTQLLRDRAEDCCGGYNLSLSVDNSTILRAIISSGDESMCSATLTVNLTNSSGTPVADTYVGFECDFSLNGVTTDESGGGEQYVSVRDLGYGDRFGCAENVVKEITAHYYDSDNSEHYYSDPVTLIFKNFVVSATVNYTYTFDEYEDTENFGSGTASLTGSVWNYASTVSINACDSYSNGSVQRAYSSSGCTSGECGENNLIDGLEYEGCLLRPNLESFILDNGKVVYRLVSLSFNTYRVPGQAWMELCKEGECDTVNVYMSSWTPWPVVPGTFECVDGTFEPITWSMSSETENANLSIIIEAYH